MYQPLRTLPLACLLVIVTIAGCTTHRGKSIADQRQAILSMKNTVLNDLYALKPDVKSQIDRSNGYAVFSNANINVFVASFGGGYGVVRDNATGQNTYMKMGEIGVGLGLGLKDFRAVMIFHTPESLQRFINKGWAFGAQADAAAKAGKQGAAVGGEFSVDDVTIYQLTKSGLALQATLKGTKFWKDDALN